MYIIYEIQSDTTVYSGVLLQRHARVDGFLQLRKPSTHAESEIYTGTEAHSPLHNKKSTTGPKIKKLNTTLPTKQRRILPTK
jgi:hypothetical protein